jgi:hypothetical protein
VEVFRLFSASAEDERIAPLEPDDRPSLPGVLDQERVDRVLRERAMPDRFPRANPNRLARCEIEKPGTGKVVENDHVRHSQNFRTPPSQ